MLENDALLKAVLEKPDDDAPRLAYADWCLKQTDEVTRARGEFIRTQITMAGLPVAGQTEQRSNLEFREEKLLRMHGRAWAGEPGTLADKVTFYRGFVELAELPARRFLEAAARLLALAPIRHLNLTGAAAVARDLFSSPYLAKIRSLSLDGCGWQDGDMHWLVESAGLPALRWLSLVNNRLGFEGARTLAASKLSKQLVHVNFEGNPVNPGRRYSTDNGNMVADWLPEEGQWLEKWHGRQTWLHAAEGSDWIPVPDRFRLRD